MGQSRKVLRNQFRKIYGNKNVSDQWKQFQKDRKKDENSVK